MTLGGDGARGGGQLLLVFEMRNGGIRKFDLNRSRGIFRGAASTQICDGRDGVVLVDATEQFTRARCVAGTVCVQQPNGSGVCITEPPGYQAPAAAILPSGPQRATLTAWEQKNKATGKQKKKNDSSFPTIKDALKR